MTSDPCLHCRCRRGLIACASEQCGYPPLPHPSCSTQRIPGTCCGATISCPPYQYKPTTATADIQSSSEPLLRVNPEYVDGLGHGISKQTPSGFFRRRSGTGRKEISGDIVNP
ncbi:PREDICTED: kielin/chordin-like protein [Priapulus caudatus]|uniref:Kielin/chordin-like protein n=1 Tax=Priapulus caudatus TaxID=37621 RepID=A0ABM1DUH8_PRICU|nr:PREDICTED: kielin/chordin-like protein [Priapulus caudatus]